LAVTLFVHAHPDDETLAMGVAIVEHIIAAHDVHVLCLTDGRGSGAHDILNGVGTSAWWGVPHDPEAEGYVALDDDAFAAARLAEHARAVACLASGLGAVTTHYAHLSAATPATVAGAIVAVADAIAPTGHVWIKTHSPVVDNHPDHVAAGDAAVALRAGNPTRYGNLRHYVLPQYWSDPRLSQVTEGWDLPAEGVASRVLNACRAYGAWAPPHSYAVGMHSVSSIFDTLMASPKSMQHLP
jgi:LmbE family N-acetylglucosaminyl deacetylase